MSHSYQEIANHALAFAELLDSERNTAVVLPKKVLRVFATEQAEALMIDTPDGLQYPHQFLQGMSELIDATGEYTVRPTLDNAEQIGLAALFGAIVARRHGYILPTQRAFENTRKDMADV